jgi:putative oxidoreductase
MSDVSREPRAIIPFLQPFYDVVGPLAWPIVRIAAGWNMIVHGYAKILRGMEKQAEMLAHDGLNFGIWFAQFLTVVELGGGIFISLGLLTRFWAAALAIELGYITFVIYWHNGFSWTSRGYEYTLMWGLICLAIALRGGGPYSLDRLIRREL